MGWCVDNRNKCSLSSTFRHERRPAFAEAAARNDAAVSWQPMSATGYKVYRGGSCIATLAANVTGYEAGDPLGHDFQVQALYGNKSSRLSDNADLA